MEGIAVWNSSELCMLPLRTVDVLDSLELKVSAGAGLAHPGLWLSLSHRLQSSHVVNEVEGSGREQH